jgi:hypothetical protein
MGQVTNANVLQQQNIAYYHRSSNVSYLHAGVGVHDFLAAGVLVQQVEVAAINHTLCSVG